MLTCTRCGTKHYRPFRLFCFTCGHLLDRDALRSVRFHGAGLLSERYRDFWESGDPDNLPRSR